MANCRVVARGVYKGRTSDTSRLGSVAVSATLNTYRRSVDVTLGADGTMSLTVRDTHTNALVRDILLPPIEERWGEHQEAMDYAKIVYGATHYVVKGEGIAHSWYELYRHVPTDNPYYKSDVGVSVLFFSTMEEAWCMGPWLGTDCVPPNAMSIMEIYDDKETQSENV